MSVNVGVYTQYYDLTIDTLTPVEWSIKEMVLQVVALKGVLLQFASKQIKEDIEVVNVAIENNAQAYKFIGEALHLNKEIALKAVGKDSYMYEYVSDGLKNDIDIIKETIKDEIVMAKFIDSNILKNKNIVLSLIDVNSDIIKYIPTKLRLDIEIGFWSVYKNPLLLKIVNPVIKKDKSISLDLVKINPNVYELLKEDFQHDREIVMNALKGNGSIISIVPQIFQKDKDVIEFIICNYKKGLEFCDFSETDFQEVFQKTAYRNLDLSIVRYLPKSFIENNENLFNLMNHILKGYGILPSVVKLDNLKNFQRASKSNHMKSFKNILGNKIYKEQYKKMRNKGLNVQEFQNIVSLVLEKEIIEKMVKVSPKKAKQIKF